MRLFIGILVFAVARPVQGPSAKYQELGNACTIGAVTIAYEATVPLSLYKLAPSGSRRGEKRPPEPRTQLLPASGCAPQNRTRTNQKRPVSAGVTSMSAATAGPA